jgi:two-component system nitrate/nitrite response regulator NarL
MSDGAPIRILIADDHAVVRDGLRRILELQKDLVVVGEAKDVAEAVQMAARLRPTVLLLDVWMPGKSGIDAIPEILQASPETRILFLTAVIQREQLLRALKMGLHGIVLKDSTSDVLIKGIRHVASGEFWIDRTTLAECANDMVRTSSAVASLTPREIEVVQEIAAGASNKEIAKSLAISEETVKRHLTHIFDKVGVSSRLELALYAIEHKLVQG